jgi:NADH dehydrogenase FAD-containing subunit
LQRWITKLAIATRAEHLTIGIKAVYGNAFFLREVHHAQEIRKKLLLSLMLSENPGKHYLCIKHLELSPFNLVVTMRI